MMRKNLKVLVKMKDKGSHDKSLLLRSFVQFKRSGDSEFITSSSGEEVPHYNWYEEIELIRRSVYKELEQGIRIDKSRTKFFFRNK
jgi:hypothetical protein